MSSGEAPTSPRRRLPKARATRAALVMEAALMIGLGCGTAMDVARRMMQAQERILERRSQRREQLDQSRAYRKRIARSRALPKPARQSPSFETLLPESDRQCPGCHNHFYRAQMSHVEVDFCNVCYSTWFDRGELARVADQSEDIPDRDTRPRRSKYRCPVCAARMRARRYLKPYALWVDECPNGHGLYLEGGELVQALQISRKSRCPR